MVDGKVTVSRWKAVLLVICSMIAGAAILAAGTYVWVAWALRDAMN